MKQKIIKPGVVRRIAEKIADEGINIPQYWQDWQLMFRLFQMLCLEI